MNTIQIKPNTKVYRLSFNSLDAAVDRAANGKSLLNEKSRNSRMVSDERTEFTGTTSFDEAYTLATKGWEEGNLLYKKYQYLLPEKLLQSILPVEDFTTKWEPTIAGGAIDMATAVKDAGPLQFWQEIDDEIGVRQGRNIQRIVVNGIVPYYSEPEIMIIRGMLVYAAVEHLETLGYSVEVAVESTVAGKKTGCLITIPVKIKDFQELLNPNKLLFAMCHPSYLRRIMFGVMETLPKNLLGELTDTYGTCSGVATRQKANTLVIDRWDYRGDDGQKQLIKDFSEELRQHFLTNDVNFDEETKEVK